MSSLPLYRPRTRPVLRIRIRRIRMFLGLLDPDPIHQSEVGIVWNRIRILLSPCKYRKKPSFLLLCDFFLTFYLWKMMLMYGYLQKGISRKNPDPLVRGMDPWIQIRIRIHAKCHGPATLAHTLKLHHGPWTEYSTMDAWKIEDRHRKIGYSNQDITVPVSYKVTIELRPKKDKDEKTISSTS